MVKKILFSFFLFILWMSQTFAQQIIVPEGTDVTIETKPSEGQTTGSDQSTTTVVQTPEGTAVISEEKAPVEIIMSVLKGNPSKGSGDLQQYKMNTGESIFVEVAQPPEQIEEAKKKENLVYEAKVGQVSSQISQKVSAIQDKEQEYASEIYPASRPPIELERQDLEKELRILDNQRTQIEAEQRAKEAQKKIQDANRPPPQPILRAGLKVQAIIDNNDKLSFVVVPSGLKGANAQKATLQTTFGSWVKILDAKDEASQIWVKAEPSK